MELIYYMDDGANWQAVAVMAYLRSHGDISASWSDEFKKYTSNIMIGRWENCREQGYVVSLRNKNYSKQLNIAFFEHRNSDSICAVKWEQTSMNTLTIDTAKFGDIYKDKYDTSKSVGYGEIVEMGEWIVEELNDFWNETANY